MRPYGAKRTYGGCKTLKSMVHKKIKIILNVKNHKHDRCLNHRIPRD